METVVHVFDFKRVVVREYPSNYSLRSKSSKDCENLMAKTIDNTTSYKCSDINDAIVRFPKSKMVCPLCGNLVKPDVVCEKCHKHVILDSGSVCSNCGRVTTVRSVAGQILCNKCASKLILGIKPISLEGDTIARNFKESFQR